MDVASRVAGGRIVVFPPAMGGEASEIDVMTLGRVAWWGCMFKRLGCPVTSLVREVSAGAPSSRASSPNDEEIRDTVLDPRMSGRFALLAEYGRRDAGSAVLLRGRLLDVRAGLPIQTLGTWSFAPERREFEFADATFELFSRTALRLGIHCGYRGWRDAFGSPVAGPVACLLRALGIVELATHGAGAPGERAETLGRLVDALRIAPGMVEAVAVLPALFELALEEPLIERDMLVAAWRRARAHVGAHLPAEWSMLPALLERCASTRGDA